MSDELLDEAINRIYDDEVSDELIDRCRQNKRGLRGSGHSLSRQA